MSLLKLLPEFHSRPWGRRDLSPLYSLPEGAKEPIGEAWLTSLECRLLEPGAREARQTLRERWVKMTAEERGRNAAGLERFPLLIKFLFTAEKLSIQVHPDNAYAREKENEPWGKTEMWHVVAAEPGGWVRVGAKPGMDPEAFRATLGKPEIEERLSHILVSAGDTIFVPAGTVHAIGPGLCLCEIQQYSDLTYRIYDYHRPGLDGKPRGLHLEQARAVARPYTPEAGKVAPQPLDRRLEGRLLAASPYFVTEKYSAEKSWELPDDPGHFDLLVVCCGRGKLAAQSAEWDYAPGDAFLALANAGPVEVRPEQSGEFLRVYVPGSA
ncbi:class I mannose-6-phosphate isomerase [Acidobacteriia bacterium AH_259_A11_L15]|nr:class I mannose-6-phosphate isomerase [Acidobacteriia bacterium AH_259_A11_L15]